MNTHLETKTEVTIKFAGDSGDGMQLTGTEFTNNTALTGSDISTFPDFPAEIRAPQGTLPGVSGFQIHFGSRSIFTPGDRYDVLVAMNAAALKTNLHNLKKGGTIIANTAGFDRKNLRLAKIQDNPLTSDILQNFQVFEIDVTKLTRTALKESNLSKKEQDRSKNMFVLGFLYWMYNRKMDSTLTFLEQKFRKKPNILAANIKALKTGYFYGETTETFTTRYEVKAADMPTGVYRSIRGNEALVIGLVTAAQKAKLPLFYGSYPITPASDILHGLAKHKHFGVQTFQAEDEIAAICASIGAAYGGSLAITGTSGPGLALKAEAMGLTTILELPLVIVDVQRGGPSTGLPTKTEQADLMQALYGRNGECPMPVLAAKSPSDCFATAIEACRIAIDYMTPVILLSDGYIANGAEPWRFPNAADIEDIKVNFKVALNEDENTFLPYRRDENHVREWALPGTKGLQHRVGGLEKEAQTGNVSYDPANHEFMVKIREAKVNKVADSIPLQTLEEGEPNADVLILGWGSTYGAIRAAVRDLLKEGYSVAHTHLRHIKPFPKNLGELLKNHKKILIPELNNGQLAKIIQQEFLIKVHQFNKIQGIPIATSELKTVIRSLF
ncbi:MAG: 2-oxoacid:acceptor oxidoreductase subunit alpha [Chitinophagales bacterium]